MRYTWTEMRGKLWLMRELWRSEVGLLLTSRKRRGRRAIITAWYPGTPTGAVERATLTYLQTQVREYLEARAADVVDDHEH